MGGCALILWRQRRVTIALVLSEFYVSSQPPHFSARACIMEVIFETFIISAHSSLAHVPFFFSSCLNDARTRKRSISRLLTKVSSEVRAHIVTFFFVICISTNASYTPGKNI